MDELNKIQKKIAQMPNEVIKLILCYTHSYQAKHLLNDIENITIIKRELIQKYWGYWGDNERNEWLINDIYSYMNEYHAMMYGYRDKFYNIFFRHIGVKNNLQFDKYIKNVGERIVESQINILLGLLTPEERCEFKNTDFW
jgi:hypothetical protein